MADLPQQPRRAPSRPSDPPLPASVGRYEVVRLLGEGAMGRVLLAHDPVLDRDVAVKYLRGDLKIPREVRAGLVERMRHEARAAARVAHPNLVVLHDMGEDPEVGLYLVFEYVEGPTLKQRLLGGDHLSAAEAARLARELASALTEAHEAGILHRDVKPENVMLAKNGGKIADFGIARIPDSTLTHQGGLMGTPAYSAPETFRGGKFSPASDQFSLAASLYEAISGRRAFPGDDAVTVAARIASESPEPFAASLGLPPAVDDVLARALSRRPEDRFPTCDDFGAALSRSLSLGTARELASVDDGGFARQGGLRPQAPSEAPASPSPPLAPSAPPERRTGQVLLGGLLVVATAALVIRTALRNAESAPEPVSTLAGLPPAAASPAPAAPRPPALVHRAPRPRLPSSSEPAGSAVVPPPPASAVVAPPTSATPAAGAADAGPATPRPSASPSASAAAPVL